MLLIKISNSKKKSILAKDVNSQTGWLAEMKLFDHLLLQTLARCIGAAYPGPYQN